MRTWIILIKIRAAAIPEHRFPFILHVDLENSESLNASQIGLHATGNTAWIRAEKRVLLRRMEDDKERQEERQWGDNKENHIEDGQHSKRIARRPKEEILQAQVHEHNRQAVPHVNRSLIAHLKQRSHHYSQNQRQQGTQQEMLSVVRYTHPSPSPQIRYLQIISSFSLDQNINNNNNNYPSSNRFSSAQIQPE